MKHSQLWKWGFGKHTEQALTWDNWGLSLHN